MFSIYNSTTANLKKQMDDITNNRFGDRLQVATTKNVVLHRCVGGGDGDGAYFLVLCLHNCVCRGVGA